uniref:2-deoxystreptamine glucosyltransferase n=2 Tax=Streptomyces kanamyceticus TaxID=1967 RepID=KANF_STRKN|nr:RecName: Full=2-deoxystreptamine glucosyltransferase; AltName: Full=2-deoxystreptamine N-acetyl-D-glucosaminyltransferase; AltName: Full=Kanamycin biosynthesis protein F [Streptomyces kanamyceticus]CAE46947.1 putative glycosyltransferase [Streptomyces kanamyceticus]
MQVQILRMSRALAELGVRQQVLTVGFPGLPRVRRDSENLVVRITRAPLPRLRSRITGLVGLNQAWLAAALTECVKLRRRWPADLIQVHLDGQLWALLAGPVAARLVGVPYTVTVHCSRLAVYQPMSTVDRIQHPLVTAVERWALRRAAGITTLTERTATVLAAELGAAQRVIDVVPDAVDPDRAEAAPAEVERLKKRFGLPQEGGPVIGFVGRIAHEKGWRHAVQAVAELADAGRDFTFLVVGDGPQRADMEAAVAEAGLTDRFVFTGFLPNDEIPAVMTALDVLLMPSVHEELGGSAVEAMLAGTPVAAYGVGGLCDTVGKVTPSLLAAPGQVAELARTVKRVLDDPAPVLAELRAGREWLADEFGVHHAAGLALAHYERVLGKER